MNGYLQGCIDTCDRLSKTKREFETMLKSSNVLSGTNNSSITKLKRLDIKTQADEYILKIYELKS